MAVTKQEILTALGLTEAQFTAAVKIASAIALLDAESVGAGGTGFTVEGLASGVAISGVSAQITGYTEAIEAQRAGAVAANEAAEAALQPDYARIAELEILEEPTTADLVELATLNARVKRVRAECTARTAAAEAFAQGAAPTIAALEERLRRLATGDLSAV
jgi:hypothetical protein